MKKQSKIALIVLILLLIVIIVSGTYAFYNARFIKNGSSTVVITSKTLSFHYDDGAHIELQGILPGQKIIKTFSVTNTGSVSQTYHLEFIDVVNELTRPDDLVYTLTSTNDGATLEETTFSTETETFAFDIDIAPNTTQEYTMVIEYKNLDEDQSVDMNKLVSATIQVNTVKRVTTIGESIYDILNKKKNLSSGYYDFIVEGDNETVTYPVHLIVLKGNQTITQNTMYGDEDDVAKSVNDEYVMAHNMVIVKVSGDYTVNQGVTVSPYHNDFGGPKGFILYVEGTLTNNGIIDNSYGAYAEGDNVYLWKNTDNSFEVVPAEGAAGAAATYSGSRVKAVKGNSGADGSTVGMRALGGGGAGGINNSDESPKSYSGAGGPATSYSGGAGGGAIDHNSNTTKEAGAATDTGLGGNALGYRQYSSWATRYASGGAGAINGLGNQNEVLNTDGQGVSGAGGLLVIYAGYIANSNTGTYTAKGHTATVWGNAQGGSSGGGSINIFSMSNFERSSIISACDVTGGVSNISAAGGDGGTGTISVAEIRNGNYFDYKLYGTSIIDILDNNVNENTGDYDFIVTANNETVTYPIHLITLNGNQTITTDTMYGNANDVASGSSENEMAKRMVVVKVNGDMTINQNVTVGPYHNEFGGPKGFLLFVTGTLTNNGTIDNSYGAYANGETVYLYVNQDGSLEYIPDTGASGAASVYNSSKNVCTTGDVGDDGSTVIQTNTNNVRALGGGGSGGTCNGDTSDGPKSSSGAGGAGSSYSGGAGGGGIDINIGGNKNATAGTDTGVGGDAWGQRKYSNWAARKASGGAGVINGRNCQNESYNTTDQVITGTGGLLIVYASTINNTGTFTATGHTANEYGRAQGGSSGGGSINIFAKTTISGVTTNTCDATGGHSTWTYSATDTGTGGHGGTGSVNIGRIINNQYTPIN